MKMNLTTWQRVTLAAIIGRMKGSVALVRKALVCLDALEMSDEDRAAVGFVSLPDGSARWEDTARRFDVEIRDREASDLVRRVVREHEGWPASMGREVLDLVEQVGGE